MKLFRKITVWLLILMMLLPTAAQAAEIAEAPAPISYADALAATNEAVEVLTKMIEDGEYDDETAEVLAGCTMQLLEVQMGMLYTAEDLENLEVPEETRDFVFTAKSKYIEEFDYNASFTVTREKGYICIESEAFDHKSKEQLDYLRFELASREDTGEIMVLFARYDCSGFLSSSNRYLVYQDGESCQMLYSRTFGKTLQYRIDLKQWEEGTDYTWNKTLLYPAK